MDFPNIKTAVGSEYRINWIGIATAIDGALRFEIPEMSVMTAMKHFARDGILPITLYEDLDTEPVTYTDFTEVAGVKSSNTGGVVVMLKKGA